MSFLTVLVASSIINLQQPVQTPPIEHNVDTDKLEEIATSFLKLRFSDADYIQTRVVGSKDKKDYDVYLAFSAESTPVNTCQLHIHNHGQQKIHVESISCINYQKKIGFREDIRTTIYE